MSWDPIGVGDAPEAQDEYDAYISPLLHLLHGGESAEVIASWLTHVVEDKIELPAQPDRERQFAQSLTEWWASATRG